jgi:hypothetical protein
MAPTQVGGRVMTAAFYRSTVAFPTGTPWVHLRNIGVLATAKNSGRVAHLVSP